MKKATAMIFLIATSFVQPLLRIPWPAAGVAAVLICASSLVLVVPPAHANKKQCDSSSGQTICCDRAGKCSVSGPGAGQGSQRNTLPPRGGAPRGQVPD